MKILVFEDRGSVSYYMVQALRKRGHIVVKVSTVYDADEQWSEGQIDAPFDAITCDLNMSWEGLSEAEVAASNDGLLTGWVWLTTRVFAANPAMRGRTIIYSDYIGDLLDTVPEAERAGVHVVSKRSADGSADGVLKKLTEIEAALTSNVAAGSKP